MLLYISLYPGNSINILVSEDAFGRWYLDSQEIRYQRLRCLRYVLGPGPGPGPGRRAAVGGRREKELGTGQIRIRSARP